MSNPDDQASVRRHFFSELSRRFARANDDYPTTHCWSYSALRRFIGRARTDLLKLGKIPASFPLSEQLVRWLEELGVAYRINVEPGTSPRSENSFFIIALGAGADSVVNPFELLQAFEPKGTICFFSALSFHHLTTQPAPFHHIATLVPRETQRRLAFNVSSSATGTRVRAKRDPLGTLGFKWDDVAFYWTRRNARLVPGSEVHVLNPQTRLRFTDLEQSLLDTLVHPLACGGEAVVFEAWAEGWSRARPARFLTYLQEAGLPLVRRFGALRDLLGFELTGDLDAFLSESSRAIDRTEMIPLEVLRGIRGRVLNAKWRVWIPA